MIEIIKQFNIKHQENPSKQNADFKTNISLNQQGTTLKSNGPLNPRKNCINQAFESLSYYYEGFLAHSCL